MKDRQLLEIYIIGEDLYNIFPWYLKTSKEVLRDACLKILARNNPYLFQIQ